MESIDRLSPKGQIPEEDSTQAKGKVTAKISREQIPSSTGTGSVLENIPTFLAGVFGNVGKLSKLRKMTGLVKGIQVATMFAPLGKAVQSKSAEIVANAASQKDLLKTKGFKLLGKGAYGQVYQISTNVLRGNDSSLTELDSKQLALKYYHADISDSAINRELSVARTVMRLNMFQEDFHKYVPKIHGIIWVDENSPIMIMKFCNLGGLDGALKKMSDEHPMDFDEMSRLNLFVGYQMLNSLDRLHEAGILHHDVRSDNFMAHQKKDGNLQILIGDLGLASTGEESDGIPEKIDIMHAPPEMDVEKLKQNRFDPELLKAWNSEKYDSYMVGLSLLLLYSPSFREENWRATMTNDMSTWVERKKKFSLEGIPIIPPAMKGIIQGLMDIDPEKRWTVSKAKEEMAKIFPGDISDTYQMARLSEMSGLDDEGGAINYE